MSALRLEGRKEKSANDEYNECPPWTEPAHVRASKHRPTSHLPVGAPGRKPTKRAMLTEALSSTDDHAERNLNRLTRGLANCQSPGVAALGAPHLDATLVVHAGGDHADHKHVAA